MSAALTSAGARSASQKLGGKHNSQEQWFVTPAASQPCDGLQLCEACRLACPGGGWRPSSSPVLHLSEVRSFGQGEGEEKVNKK